MKNTMKVLGLAALVAGIPAAGSAQIGAAVSIDLAFPEPPPLVVVSPGVQIVPEYEEEVYYVNSWYWVRRDGYWYRTHDYRGGWAPVGPRYVPVSLNRIPPGHYRHYYRDDDGRWRAHQADEYRAWRERNSWEQRRGWWHEHRNDQAMRREQDRAWRDRQRAERDQQRAEREHQRIEAQRQRDEQQRMRHEQQREQQERMREAREQDRARRDQERAQRQPQPQRHEDHGRGPDRGPGGPHRR